MEKRFKGKYWNEYHQASEDSLKEILKKLNELEEKIVNDKRYLEINMKCKHDIKFMDLD